MVLLDAVDQLKSALHLDLTAIHVHHGLSANADAWAAFCLEVCDTRSIALTTKRVVVDKSSPSGLEGAARAARYAAFAESGSQNILFAHASQTL